MLLEARAHQWYSCMVIIMGSVPRVSRDEYAMPKGYGDVHFTMLGPNFPGGGAGKRSHRVTFDRTILWLMWQTHGPIIYLDCITQWARRPVCRTSLRSLQIQRRLEDFFGTSSFLVTNCLLTLSKTKSWKLLEMVMTRSSIQIWNHPGDV